MSYMHYRFLADVDINDMLQRIKETEEAIASVNLLLSQTEYNEISPDHSHSLGLIHMHLVSRRIMLEDECLWQFARDYFIQRAEFNHNRVIFRCKDVVEYGREKTALENYDANNIQAVVVDMGYEIF